MLMFHPQCFDEQGAEHMPHAHTCQAALVLACLGISGCVAAPTARYVYQDAEFGVVAIARNTFLDKPGFRAQAESLMARHFPEGYEIIRAEEVTEGERTLDFGKRTEIDSNPNISAMNQSVQIGRLAHVTSYQEKDRLVLRECRIVYRKRPSQTGPPREFAPVAWLSPPLYIDPNEAVRHHGAAQSRARSAALTKTKLDTDAKPVSSEAE
jgi:hypothetical protein